MTQFKANAWGKRGHEAIGSIAARVLSEKQKGAEFLMHHSFDMGFYNNVPDLVWKSNPKTYQKEYFQHFMDMEEFSKVKNTKWSENRDEFFKEHKTIPKSAGRAWWRIQELNETLSSISKNLKQKKISLKEHQKQQILWLLYAGVMGHYISDLAQPLHVTSNYDGQSTSQSGIHKWFEESVVDYLYPGIINEVYIASNSKWDSFHQENKSKNIFELCQMLTKNSQNYISEILEIDKKIGRKELSVSSKAYKQLVIDRLTVGTLYLAEIWSRETGWDYKGDKFFLFESKPNYIEPKGY